MDMLNQMEIINSRYRAYRDVPHINLNLPEHGLESHINNSTRYTRYTGLKLHSFRKMTARIEQFFFSYSIF